MAVSFQGITTGIQTDQLVAAILAQEGQSVQRMVDKQAFNKLRTTALQSVRKGMSDLSTSLAAVQDRFNARTVTSTDSNGVYVTATANGAAAGNYDLKVNQVATRARVVLGSTTDPSTAITGLSAGAEFAVQGTDGTIKTFTLANSSLNGLRDAINASGASVKASIINTGDVTVPYKLVISAKDTGTGGATGTDTIRLVAKLPADASAIGIADGTVDNWAAPTTISNGLFSQGSDVAVDAKFNLNGVDLIRHSNVVSDAADGITFTLKQGSLTPPTTTLTVALDKTAATTGLQDVLSKYNALRKTYLAAATSTKDASGAIVPAPLSSDQTTRSLLSQIQIALTGPLEGISSGSLTSLSQLGVSTGADGSLSLNTSTFQAALEKDPKAVQNLFTFSTSSSSGALALREATSNTQTTTLHFDIQSDGAGGFLGTFNSGANGTNIASVNGTFSGLGVPYEGLTLNVLGAGSGDLNLARGGGQKARDLISQFTSGGTGGIAQALSNIDVQTKALDQQIAQGQARLDRRKLVLQRKFSAMETAVAQMKAAVGGLSGLG